jgi:hypothetical protein
MLFDVIRDVDMLKEPDFLFRRELILYAIAKDIKLQNFEDPGFSREIFKEFNWVCDVDIPISTRSDLILYYGIVAKNHEAFIIGLFSGGLIRNLLRATDPGIILAGLLIDILRGLEECKYSSIEEIIREMFPKKL